MAAMARLNRIWQCNTKSFASKFKLYKSVLTSILRQWNMDPACWLRKKNPDFQNQVLAETSLHLLVGAQDQWLGAEQDLLPSGSIGTFSGNCRETETCMVRACHMPWQLLQNHLSGYLLTLEGGCRKGRQRNCWMDRIKEWTTLPMSELLTRTSCRKHWKRILCWIPPPPPPAPMNQSVNGLNWTLVLLNSSSMELMAGMVRLADKHWHDMMKDHF